MTALAITELSQGTLDGTGVFDVLMRSVKAHLDSEFTKGRIKGPEYSTVYLGSIDLAMQNGLAFVLQQRKNDLEALLVQAQIDLVTQQVTNATAEALNIPKQGLVLDAQKNQIVQQTANALVENDVLVAQKCKLQAEFDLTTATTAKAAEELALLTQKTATERAQTQATGVDADSVVGRQKGLYSAQTNGFTRDAEQKAAKLMADTWSVRRTTDEATVADGVNLLNDVAVGRAITKLLAGVGA